MATKKKSSTKKKSVDIETPAVIDQEEEAIIPEPEEISEPQKKPAVIKSEEVKKKLKFKIGDIVYITRDTEADLRGVGLFPQHKKYTYTVEDYNPLTDTYTIRRLNALLYLKSDHLLSPEEKAHDSLNKAQY